MSEYKNIKQNLIIHGLYRPPNASKLEFYEYISTVMQNLVNKYIMFVGDFNIDILDEVNASEFSNIKYSYHFFPLYNIPTRVTENVASCLDHIWYNSFNSLISGSFILDVSDHYPSFTTLNIALNNVPVKHIFSDHSIKNINKLIDSMPNFQHNFNLLFNYDVNKKQNGLLKNCGNYTIVAALKKLKLCHIKLISSRG